MLFFSLMFSVTAHFLPSRVSCDYRAGDCYSGAGKLHSCQGRDGKSRPSLPFQSLPPPTTTDVPVDGLPVSSCPTVPSLSGVREQRAHPANTLPKQSRCEDKGMEAGRASLLKIKDSGITAHSLFL